MYAGRLTFLLAALVAALLDTGDANFLNHWVPYNGQFYSFSQEKVTWTEGVALCRAYGGNLVEIRSGAENAWVISEIIRRHMGGIWIGSSDIFREGHWNWISDLATVASGADWSPNQPDNFNRVEHCLEIRAQFGYKWNDWTCQERNNIVCKRSGVSAN